MTQPRLVVIDDEADLAGFVADVAEQAGFAVEQFNSAMEFMDRHVHCADVIVLDLMMPGVDGIEVIRFLADIECDARLVLVSGFDPGVLHSAQKLAVEQGLHFAGSLNKPFRYNDLLQLLNELAVTPRSGTEPAVPAAPSVEEVRAAIANEQLCLHYQPKIGLSDYRVVGVEALVRWQHPVHGLLGPDHFVPVAEKHGLIDALTWAVLELAMRQCRAWCDDGIELQVAVNMSAGVFGELGLPERIDGMMQAHGLHAPHLILEVTETMLMQELTRSLDILTRLRMKGFNLSIDDFGTGYSSLVQLHRAPFSEIKIDKSFVMEMEHDNEAAAIVETVTLLGHKLGMKVVAEGVEDHRALLRLGDIGCDLAQGFHIALPQPAAELTPWLQEHLGQGAA